MFKPEISGNVIVIPSDTIYLAAIDDFISEKLTDKGVSNSIAADMSISVSEIVNNAIIHGNEKNSSKKVVVTIELKQNDLKISVKDEGNGFSPDNIPDPTERENLLKKVGRGIFIVRSLVDSVDFSFTNEGTEVIIKKKLTRE